MSKKNDFFNEYHQKIIDKYKLPISREQLTSIRIYALNKNLNLQEMIAYVKEKINRPHQKSKQKLKRNYNKEHYAGLIKFLSGVNSVDNLIRKTKFDG